MRGSVVFTKVGARGILESLRGSGGSGCVCVYSKKSALSTPEALSADGVEYVEFGNLSMWIARGVADDHGGDALVVLGLSTMIRPSNRCDRRFEYLYGRGGFASRHVIDDVPYRMERWRVWYPYGLAVPNLMGYPHSYAIEVAYRGWEEGRSEYDPVSVDLLVPLLSPYTTITYERFFERIPRYEVMPTTEEDKVGYQREKERLFKESTSPPAIVRGLADYCQFVCPFRTMSLDTGYLYKGVPEVVVMTDLKVDQYLRSEAGRLISDTNALTEGLYARQEVSRK